MPIKKPSIVYTSNAPWAENDGQDDGDLCPAVCHPRMFTGHPWRDGFAGVARSVVVDASDPLTDRRVPSCSYSNVERWTTTMTRRLVEVPALATT